MNVLITGMTGFVGSHMAEFCLDQGVKVFGTVRWRSQMENVVGIQDRVHLVECDLTDAASVQRMIAQVQPDRVFHLAAQRSRPPLACPQEPILTPQLNLFAAGDLDPDPVAGSSEEYGRSCPMRCPSGENPLRPLSPYG